MVARNARRQQVHLQSCPVRQRVRERVRAILAEATRRAALREVTGTIRIRA